MDMKQYSIRFKRALGTLLGTLIIALAVISPNGVQSHSIEASSAETKIRESSISALSAPQQYPKSFTATVTGYSSTPDQTDDTPFITAANTPVRDGIVAANFLPIGTRIKIPGYSGPKIYTVEDRMHARFSDRVDIWFVDRASAQYFGKRDLEIVIVAMR